MTKKNTVIDISKDAMCDIPNDNDATKPVKEKKIRAKKVKEILDSFKKTSETIPETIPETDAELIVPEPSEPEPSEPEPSEPEPPKPPEPIIEEQINEEPKLRKVLNLVQCDKCGRKMTEKTLKYSHVAICPANKKPEDINKPTRTKKNKIETIELPIEQLEPVTQAPIMPLLRRQTSNTMVARQDRLNQKKEMFKQMLVNAF